MSGWDGFEQGRMPQRTPRRAVSSAGHLMTREERSELRQMRALDRAGRALAEDRSTAQSFGAAPEQTLARLGVAVPGRTVDANVPAAELDSLERALTQTRGWGLPLTSPLDPDDPYNAPAEPADAED